MAHMWNWSSAPRFRANVAALLCSLMLPGVASAQSQFVGRVTDATGGVLPGVTVDAASDVLIERVKTAVTDGEGRYTIVDLRPGIYTVTFRVTGFATVVRDKLGCRRISPRPSMRDAHQRLEETVTVSGASPIVDVTQAQRTRVMSREVPVPFRSGAPCRHAWRWFRSSPPQRTWAARSRWISTTSVSRAPRTTRPPCSSTADAQQQQLDGASWYYFNDAMAQQMSIQTRAARRTKRRREACASISCRRGRQPVQRHFLRRLREPEHDVEQPDGSPGVSV